VRSGIVNPSNYELALSHLSASSPNGCANNRESTGGSQFFVNIVTLPFSEPLAFPLEIQAR
jgi:hypothetical protein